MPLPAALVRYMRRQHGLVRRRQVLEAGIPEPTLDAWIRRGELEVVQQAVYRRPGAETTSPQAVLAAVYRAGAGARATGWSACGLYGLEAFELRSRPWVAVPSERRVRGVDFVVQRTPLEQTDLATVAGIPAVTPTRALIDAAGRVGAKALRVGVDDARRRGLVQLERMLSRATALGRHRGAVVVRRLFGEGALDQDGELERRLAVVLADAGLLPSWGVEVLPGIIADACFPEASYIVECDGRRWHTIDGDIAADITREAVLRADGWHVDRVTASDMRRDAAAVVGAICERRAARIASGLGRPAGWRPVHRGRRLRPPDPNHRG